MTLLFRAIFTATLLSVAVPSPAQAQVVQPFASGLLRPAKVVGDPDGTFLVAEAGSGPNTGRVSLVDRDGRRFTVVDGLPSGLHGPRLDPSGPAGVLLSGRRLYIVIGNGDISVPGGCPASEIPNPAPNHASMNLVWNVQLQPSITLDTLTTVAPVPNPLTPMGGPLSEAVPASIRVSGDSLLVPR